MREDLLQVPCPACGGVQEVAESSVPENGVISCLFCGEQISFRQAPSQAPSQSRSHPPVTGIYKVPGSPLPPPQEDAGPSLGALDDWLPTGPVPEESPSGSSVCCPRCGHSFDPEAEATKRPTVLVVEDTEFFLTLATEVLGNRYRTLEARNAAEARKLLARERVDLLVLDLTLPDAEGTEVLRALPNPDTPVLVYTSRDETSLLGEEWELLQALGADDVVHKGINIEETLSRKADDLLGVPST